MYLVRVDAAGTIRNRILLGTACINPGEADDRPSVPPPPTVAEIRDAVPLPHLDIHTSPIERGLTGLETWFWCNADTTRTVTVGIRGYEVTAHAHVTGYQWITGDGHTYSSKTCGQQPDPDGTGYGAAARHTYETKDFYDLELHATWSGSYSFTGHGRSRSGDLEGVTVASTRRYPVWEVRTVLTD